MKKKEESTEKVKLSRRTFIALASAFTGALVLGRNQITRWLLTRQTNESLNLSNAIPLNSDVCVLTAEQLEGPYYIKSPIRSDIRDNKPGLPLKLKINVSDVNSCEPIPNAVVDIWQCDAAGVYSGHRDDLSRSAFDISLIVALDDDGHVDPITDEVWLRGVQSTDQDGNVEFQTIFPGWYETRITHIHIKVYTEEKSYLTTQLYFTDELANDIYSNHPDYVEYGATPYNHQNDLVLAGEPEGTGLLLNPVETEDGLVAEIKLGVS